MKKILIFFLFFFLTLLRADYLYSNKNRCINDFYYLNGSFYYRYSKDGDKNKYHSTWLSNQVVLPGYFYDSQNKTCKINNTAVKLGITSVQYYFLMGLAGLFLGLIVVLGFMFAFIK